MDYLFALLALAVSPVVLLAQTAAPNVSVEDKVRWLTDHSGAIRSIEPQDRDYADLQPLRQSIGSARIVMLGGTAYAGTVKAKDRVIRFLHEEMGFDVLFVPAEPLMVEQLDQALDHGQRPNPQIVSAISVAWPTFVEVLPPLPPPAYSNMCAIPVRAATRCIYRAQGWR